MVGYTPDHLIDLFVEEKTTGVEMCPEMEAELLSVKDPPVLISTPKPSHVDKSRLDRTRVETDSLSLSGLAVGFYLIFGTEVRFYWIPGRFLIPEFVN